ncbi:MAG: helix-turn-helix transcriptional regulator [Dysgonamonadaceae bacterium]|jgi:transcriptional regulator with XRE-family HTH domain|nr:helix-turn-helix transcriptional regulator [Dysgonamonadaceae bacterium]
METDIPFLRKTHHGRNVKALRDMLGIKQEVLAKSAGITQQYVSVLEAQEKIDDEMLEKLANVLHIPVDAIKNFNEEKAVNIISNTFQDAVAGSDVTQYNKCTFNPVDKIIELCEQNAELYKKLLEEKEAQITLLKAIAEKLKGKN